MRRLYRSKLVNLGLILCLITIVIAGYLSSAETPPALARSRSKPGLNAGLSQGGALQGTNQLVVIAFSDTVGAGPFECPGCDKIYSSEDQVANSVNPLPPMTFIIRNARTGEELGRQEAQRQPTGRYQAVFELPIDMQEDVVLTLAATPAGFLLCPNAPSSRIVSPADFILGTHTEVYSFWTGCPLPGGPTATPIPPTPVPVLPTATPVPPTPTPQPPPATPVPTATPLPERSIVIEAFTDVAGPGGLECPGCDRIFSSSDQIANAVDPLPNMDFVLRDAETGRLLARQTTTTDLQGRARTLFQIPAGFDRPVTVELASVPGGYQLCPNVSPLRRIEPTDFILGIHLEQFPFWKGCVLPPPAQPSPTPLLLPSPTPVPPTVPPPTPTAVPAISPTQTPPAMPPGTLGGVVTARGLNIRRGPGVEYTRLGALTGGTALILDGRNEDGTWVHGQAPEAGLEGWVAAAYVRIEGDVMTLPVSAVAPPEALQATPTPPAVSTLTAVVTARGLNVRAGPGVEYTRLGAVAGGTELTLDGRNGDGTWVHGQAPEAGLEGWLAAAYMNIEGDAMSLPVIKPVLEEEATPTPTEPPATPTPSGIVIPQKLPQTGVLGIPTWGLLAMAAAILLALGHVWRWVRATPLGYRSLLDSAILSRKENIDG